FTGMAPSAVALLVSAQKASMAAGASAPSFLSFAKFFRSYTVSPPSSQTRLANGSGVARSPATVSSLDPGRNYPGVSGGFAASAGSFSTPLDGGPLPPPAG